MTVYPVSAVFMLLWLWVTLKDPDKGLTVALAAFPFGMLAAVNAGGLSILMAHALAAMTLAVFALRRVSGRLAPMRVPPAGIYLWFFGLYALFSAIILVRLFSGTFLVFPMSFDLKGVAVSTAFYSTMKPLAVSNSNISQAGYILLSCIFFLVVADVLRRRGPAIVEAGLVWAAGLNVVLGFVDMLGADDLLSVIRTAHYSLNNHHVFFGFPRVIGGFAEASEFGAFSATMFAYFGLSFLIGRKRLHGQLALGNLACAALSFSSTGYASVFAAVIVILLSSRRFLGRGISWAFGHGVIFVPAIAGIGLSVALITTPLLDLVGEVTEFLFVEKAMSSSGLERMAWARSALNAFFQTWGLGAGVGSLRANGLIAVLLGSVGIPGTVAFIAFVWTAFRPIGSVDDANAMRYFHAARAAALTLLSAKLVSGTTPDPTLVLMAVAAVATHARLRGVSSTGAAAAPDALIYKG